MMSDMKTLTGVGSFQWIFICNIIDQTKTQRKEPEGFLHLKVLRGLFKGNFPGTSMKPLIS